MKECISLRLEIEYISKLVSSILNTHIFYCNNVPFELYHWWTYQCGSSIVFIEFYFFIVTDQGADKANTSKNDLSFNDESFDSIPEIKEQLENEDKGIVH